MMLLLLYPFGGETKSTFPFRLQQGWELGHNIACARDGQHVSEERSREEHQNHFKIIQQGIPIHKVNLNLTILDSVVVILEFYL
jgi:hypothetical protein